MFLIRSCFSIESITRYCSPGVSHASLFSYTVFFQLEFSYYFPTEICTQITIEQRYLFTCIAAWTQSFVVPLPLSLANMQFPFEPSGGLSVVARSLK